MTHDHHFKCRLVAIYDLLRFREELSWHLGPQVQ